MYLIIFYMNVISIDYPFKNSVNLLVRNIDFHKVVDLIVLLYSFCQDKLVKGF